MTEVYCSRETQADAQPSVGDEGAPRGGRVGRLLGERHSVGRQAIRFLGFTAASGAASLGIPILLHEGTGISAELAVAIAFVLVFVMNFAVVRAFVFKARNPILVDFGNFAASSLVFRGAEYLLFLALFRFAGIYYVVALGAALLASTVGKFLWYRRTFHGA